MEAFKDVEYKSQYLQTPFSPVVKVTIVTFFADLYKPKDAISASSACGAKIRILSLISILFLYPYSDNPFLENLIKFILKFIIFPAI